MMPQLMFKSPMGYSMLARPQLSQKLPKCKWESVYISTVESPLTDLTQLAHWRGSDHLQIVVPGSRLLPSRMWLVIVRYERSGWLPGKRPAARDSDSVGGGEAVASFIRPLWMLNLWVPKQPLGDHPSTVMSAST